MKMFIIIIITIALLQVNITRKNINIHKHVINEQCSYKFELGNQSCTDATRFRMLTKSSALHLQICATQTLISFLP